MTAELAIDKAFPGEDEPHRSVRIALLRLLHAADSTDAELDWIKTYLENTIENPPWSIQTGPEVLQLRLAQHLRALAAEVDKAYHALAAASLAWLPSADSPKVGAASEQVRQPRADTQDDALTTVEDFPF